MQRELDQRLSQAWSAYDRGDLEGAASAFDQAVALAPGDADLALVRARIAVELGQPAGALFERAQALAPDDLEIAIGRISARHDEGDAAGAIAELGALTAANRAWTTGHAVLAQMRWQAGARADFATSFEAATRADPADRDMWVAYLSTLSRAERYADLLTVIERARAALGRDPLLDQFEAVAAAETRDHARAEALFARMDFSQGGPRIPYLRHLLRTGRPELAARTGEALLGQAAPQNVWPYLAIAWRMTGDARWDWLEGDERLVAAIDIEGLDDLLPALAPVLRGLHRAKTHPYDQTLRGGTQTYGVLLNRAEPEIRALRESLRGAVARYVAALPPIDPRHPFLAAPRSSFKFAGSWSVLLQAQGRHVNHVHPGGWISSAFYVELPDEVRAQDAGHAGWLGLGEPPAELELGLQATRLIEPKPGRLALFPSILWHGTQPFARGERLTVAFDVTP